MQHNQPYFVTRTTEKFYELKMEERIRINEGVKGEKCYK
jgi:hypothetical protein